REFTAGRLYLLFLDRYDGYWELDSRPLARVSEEVAERHDPWLAAVRQYLRIAELGAGEPESDALRRLRAGAQPALSRDIDHHLAHPSPHKALAELRAMFVRADDPARRTEVVRAVAAAAEPEARRFMKDRLRALRRGAEELDSEAGLAAVARYFAAVGDSEAITALAEMAIAAGARDTSGNALLVLAVSEQAGPEHYPLVMRLYRSSPDYTAEWLAAWFARHPSKRAAAAIRARVKGKYASHRGSAAALAALGDRAVVRWAVARLKRVGDVQRALAITIVARSPLRLADRAAGQLIRTGRARDLLPLVTAYSEARHPLAARRLAEIAALQTLDSELRSAVEQARSAGQTASE
ncbi:MAG: hypothetical protein AAGC55_09075, partial [Myxococcota bacterium]